MQKIKIILLTLFLSVPCLAQQPRIDSIAVDEDNSKLVLYGSFPNPWYSTVLVDSSQMVIREASDTLIRTLIPDSGRGSAGWVSVTNNGIESNKKLLTYTHFLITHCFARMIFNTVRDDRAFDTIHVRGNFIDMHNPTTFISSKLSSVFDNGAEVLRAPLTFYPQDRILTYVAYPSFGTSDSITIISYDKTFTVVPGYIGSDSCGVLGVEGFYWGPIAPTDFPPSIASVHETPSNPNILQVHLSSDPMRSNADLIITLQNQMNLRIEILDILGHIISSDEKMLQAGENKLPINSSALPSGIYICRLQAGGEVVSVRFVKE